MISNTSSVAVKLYCVLWVLDPWYQLAFLLAVSFNGGYILGLSNFILKPLGWIWGIEILAALVVLSLYANLLLANLHIIDGRGFIRSIDLIVFTLGVLVLCILLTLINSLQGKTLI